MKTPTSIIPTSALVACILFFTTLFAEAAHHEGSGITEGLEIEFQNSDAPGAIPYYHDRGRDCWAVNAARVPNRNGFATAVGTFEGEAGTYTLELTTLGEIDGDSPYRVWVNDNQVGSFQNPSVEEDYTRFVFAAYPVRLEPGDEIRVQSAAVTNGKIPEGNGTAWARGRWASLVARQYEPK